MRALGFTLKAGFIVSSSFRAPPAFSSDEIDLVALFRSVWKLKKWVLLVTVFVAGLAGAYAFLSTPEYQVSSVLRPAAIHELDALNRSGVYQLPPSEALTKVAAALESYETRLGFFRENQKLFKEFERPGRTLEQSFEEFNRDSITLSLPDPKKADLLTAYIQLDMTYPKAIDGVSIVNGFVDYAIESERARIAADVAVIVKNRLNEIKGRLAAARSGYDAEKKSRIAALREADTLRRSQLEDELKALRTQLKTQRADRMAQLSEAIGIAKSLGIKKPTTPSLLGEADRAGTATVMRTEVNSQQSPLYFMGVDALEAERNALMQRKSDDFTEVRISQIAKELQLLQSNRQVEVLNRRENEELFLQGVQSLHDEEARLNNLSIDMSRLRLVTIDKKALEPLGPIKPKKTLILIVGLFLGLVLGIMVAIVYSLLGGRRAHYWVRSAEQSVPVLDRQDSFSNGRIVERDS